MDKSKYKDQLVMNCHLNTPSYKEVDAEIDKAVYKELEKLCLKHQQCITLNEKKAIMDEDWHTSRFYLLPKIDKSKAILETIQSNTSECIVQMPMPNDLTSRPIVSGPKSVTKGLSQLLEKILTPLTFHLKTFIKNEMDFLRKFPRNIGTNSHVMCCDVTSLYTSIPNELGMQALEYWIRKKSALIPKRFSEAFIMESAEFVLKNNFFVFGDRMWRQVIGTAMGKEMASPYACLTVGYLEETILFPKLLPKFFKSPILEQIIEHYFRFVDDGIIVLPNDFPAEKFLEILNSMHPSIQFTITKSTTTTVKGKEYKTINFLSVKVLTSPNGELLTDIYYKDTNSHDYLNYNSHHPTHVKDNIAYCLAKTIIIFTTDEDTMEENLNDLRKWLLNCGHPRNIIEKGIHNARLQGPAEAPTKKTTVPFISTYYSNYDNGNTLITAKNLIQNSKNKRIQEAFKDAQFIRSYRQPPNLLHQVTNANFITGVSNTIRGITLCGRDLCKICALYLQECDSFETSNGTLWEIRCHIHCNSLNVLYFLVCNFCSKVTKTGKTDNLRDRTNNHITCCRWGSGTDIFDLHVHACAKKQRKKLVEPYFKLYAFMTLKDYDSLRNHERRLHLQGHDTINNPNIKNSSNT